MIHGLINRAIQDFLRDTYGGALWASVARDAGLTGDGFEPMLPYPCQQTSAVIDAAVRRLDRPREALLEDLGTYLVSFPGKVAPRRLLRFGGIDFPDFLLSLEELRDRGRLAVADLDLPALEVEETAPDRFHLTCRHDLLSGAGYVLVGLLRAMADDYGALVVIEHLGQQGGAERIVVNLLDQRFARGRQFDLAATVT